VDHRSSTFTFRFVCYIFNGDHLELKLARKPACTRTPDRAYSDSERSGRGAWTGETRQSRCLARYEGGTGIFGSSSLRGLFLSERQPSARHGTRAHRFHPCLYIERSCKVRVLVLDERKCGFCVLA
jgi:hypothetical protein